MQISPLFAFPWCTLARHVQHNNKLDIDDTIQKGQAQKARYLLFGSAKPYTPFSLFSRNIGGAIVPPKPPIPTNLFYVPYSCKHMYLGVCNLQLPK